jgi:small subunit ribosomal protein S4
MARYTGPKIRLMRREGKDLGLKSKKKQSVVKRITVSPGLHGHKQVRKKVSAFGQQLREKQKVKRTYGMLERQFRKFFDNAMRMKGNTGENFLTLLERRLDNVVYRLGLASTRNFARQLVNHGHVYVDGVRVSVPSFLVKPEMVVTLSAKALEIPALKEYMEAAKDDELPSWLIREGVSGKVSGMPVRDDIDADIKEAYIIEYYSR